MFVTAGIGLSLTIMRFSSAGWICLGGTIGAAVAHFCFGTDEAGANGFVLGGLLGIVILGA